MYCPHCGTESITGNGFCRGCGAELEQEQAPPRPVRARVQVPHLGRAFFVWLGVGLVTLALLIVSACFLATSTRIVTTYETVAFRTETQSDAGLLEGVQYTMTPGETGTQLVRTKEWLDSDGFVENRKVVAQVVIDEPVPEFVVAGTRSLADTTADVGAVAGRYVEAWRASDYAAMLAECTAESLGGRDPSAVAAAATAAAETVGVVTLDAPVISGMQDLLTSSTGQEDALLLASDYPYGSLAVALVPASLEIWSPVTGSRESVDGIRLAYTSEGWKVIYEGPLAVIEVDQTQSFSQADWGTVETAKVTLEKILLYSDHVVLVVSETNVTQSQYGSSSMASQFRDLGDDDTPVFGDDSLTGASYVVDTDRSFYAYDLDEGTTQRGSIYVEPGLSAGATLLHVRLPEVQFLNVQVPVQ